LIDIDAHFAQLKRSVGAQGTMTREVNQVPDRDRWLVKAHGLGGRGKFDVQGIKIGIEAHRGFFRLMFLVPSPLRGEGTGGYGYFL